jgi:negative regulator of sigma-B (phosphoserine phosphatase)
MRWIGVGNVTGVLLRRDHAAASAPKALLLRAGVVGGALPPLQASTVQVSPGDTLILATDGVGSGFSGQVRASDPPQKTADDVLRTHVKGTDDATVLVARFLGEAP